MERLSERTSDLVGKGKQAAQQATDKGKEKALEAEQKVEEKVRKV